MSSESILFNALKIKYPSNAYALFSQVRNTTGTANMVTTADALCIGLWPSRGMEVEGFEMKVSRADWLKEMKTPAKAEQIAKFCDRWWLVIDDAAHVKDGELPPTWGLLVLKGDKLVCKKQAPKLESIPMTKPFMASLLRRVQDTYVVRAEVQKEINDSYQNGLRRGSSQTGEDAYKRALDAVQKSIKDFETASGVRIDLYNGRQIGEAVQFVMRHDVREPLRQLKYVQDFLKRTLSSVDQAVADGSTMNLEKVIEDPIAKELESLTT